MTQMSRFPRADTIILGAIELHYAEQVKTPICVVTELQDDLDGSTTPRTSPGIGTAALHALSSI